MEATAIALHEATHEGAATSGRFRELDGLRGIAAFAVLLSHYTWEFDVIFPGHTPFPASLPLGALGVSLFFMISGFVILMTAERKPQPTRFAQARAVRLYPTYWACLTITILVVYLSGTSALFRTPGELAVNYTMLQSFVGVRSIDGAYWSLSREIIFYGIIFVRDDLVPAGTDLLKAAGTPQVYGSVILEGSAKINGSPGIIYNKAVLQNIFNSSQFTRYGPVPGSWSDTVN